MAENLITQVSQDANYPSQSYQNSNSVDYDSKIHLNVRGSKFTITRDELMSLPESILLCLFPNGAFLDINGNAITNLTEEDTVHVNFEPSCFEYIVDTFGAARRDLNEMPQLSPVVSFGGSSAPKETAASVLQSKPAIIVLREDLDYYVISPVAGVDADQMRHLKLSVATDLIGNKKIFSGLGYNPSLNPSIKQTLGPAEQHLLDMLCSSGFETTGEWGSRSMEPGKCVISSLSLVRLQTQSQAQPTPPDSPALDPVTSTSSVSSSARKSRSRIANLASSATRAASRSLSKSRKVPDSNQTKLLLFWRKPARKCWWSNETIEIDVAGMVVGNETFDTMKVKVHIRRVWTLELSVIGVN
ncbi:growth regulation protein [[Candida] anglica]|uniref:Growth regulation protein n=1 Tax=[Candida] anglica TaxID=148631 RepID=A0ABP0E971_9ASCO